MITTIIFDVGGVLHVNHNVFVKEDIITTLKVSPAAVDQAWQELIPTLLGKGRITEQEFWQRFKELVNSSEPLPQQSLLSREFIRHYEPIKGSLDLIRHLKKNGYRLAILSDTIPNHADVAKEKGHFNAFDHLFLSYQVHHRKSDRDLKIFKLALKNLKSKPAETVFIDDKAEYVADAQKLGINGILFQNPVQLETDLRKLGVKTKFIPDKEETNIGCHASSSPPKANSSSSDGNNSQRSFTPVK